jgi:hypothetical protein
VTLPATTRVPVRISRTAHLRTLSAAVIVGMAAVLVCSACAPLTLPAGPGEDAEDAMFAAYLEAVERFCFFPSMDSRATFTAEVSVRGTSNGRPVRGRVWVGVDPRYRSLRLESAEDVPPQFILTSEHALPAASGGSAVATLLFPREQLIVHRESSRALLEAVLGLPLSAPEFVSAFTGCQSLGGYGDAKTFGQNVMRMSIGTAPHGELFLRRHDPQSPWTLFAMTGEVEGRTLRWRAEYDRRPEHLSRAVRIVSQERSVTGRLFDLHLSLSRIQIAPLVGSEIFTPTVPASARHVSLETVQRQRPQPLLPLLSVAP